MNPVVMVVFIALAATPQPVMDTGMITPKHGILYNLDILLDNIWVALSPDKQTAIINILNERLAEIVETGDVRAISDYESKLSELNTLQSPLVKQTVIDYLQIHRDVLEEVEDRVPDDAKPFIRHAITESSKVIEKIKMEGKSKSELEKRFTSHISVPNSVRVGEEVKVSFKICNPLNEPVQPVVHVTASKVGVPGDVIRREGSRTLPIIQPGQCYTDTLSTTIPSEYMDIPLKGQWRIEVEVTAGDTTILERVFFVSVS